jgi:hypothetical protein
MLVAASAVDAAPPAAAEEASAVGADLQDDVVAVLTPNIRGAQEQTQPLARAQRCVMSTDNGPIHSDHENDDGSIHNGHVLETWELLALEVHADKFEPAAEAADLDTQQVQVMAMLAYDEWHAAADYEPAVAAQPDSRTQVVQGKMVDVVARLEVVDDVAGSEHALEPEADVAAKNADFSLGLDLDPDLLGGSNGCKCLSALQHPMCN